VGEDVRSLQLPLCHLQIPSSRQEPVYHFQQKLRLVGREDMTGLRHENKLSPGHTPGDDAAVLGRQDMVLIAMDHQNRQS